MEKPIYKKATVQGLALGLFFYFLGPDFADIITYEQSVGLSTLMGGYSVYGFQRRFPSAEKTP